MDEDPDNFGAELNRSQRLLRDVYPNVGDSWGGTFDILEMIAVGSYGIVYRVVNRKKGVVRALKVLRIDLLGAENAEAMFLREMDVLSVVHPWEQHPEIVNFCSRGAIHGIPYLEMEYLEGETLADHLHPPFRQADRPMQRLPVGELLRGLRQIVIALDVLHTHGIVHGDLKPSNIFSLSEVNERRMVLIDFGAVRGPCEDINPMPDGVVTCIGTAGYIAPEQARGEEVDGRADIWSFGAVLLRYLYSKCVHGTCTEAEAVERAKAGDIRLPSPRLDQPLEVYELMRRALQAEPAKRFQSAKELLSAIDQAIVACDAYDVRSAEHRRHVAKTKRFLRAVHLTAALTLLMALTR